MQLVVGRIGRAHGIAGEVAVDVRTDDPHARFAPGAVLGTEPPSAGPLTVAGARPHSGRLLVCFHGVPDRNTAEALRGVLLVADSATSPPTGDADEYWDHQLVGLAVRTASGESLGEVSEVLHPPGGELLVVRRDGDREVLIPFVAKIVPSVDLAGGYLLVDPPPGLLDLSEG